MCFAGVTRWQLLRFRRIRNGPFAYHSRSLAAKGEPVVGTCNYVTLCPELLYGMSRKGRRNRAISTTHTPLWPDESSVLLTDLSKVMSNGLAGSGRTVARSTGYNVGCTRAVIIPRRARVTEPASNGGGALATQSAAIHFVRS